ncbi:ornithine decarboxylase [Thamnocephalis sphaerospora]|uniref:ornithine decarboxylase n=1 Tax=Thamnocephalis sphaerospora TaxID=78915 RepID=A0A4P9XRS8_9FUNG|nr:ornithine decarboxylase [Thamnocephalis sphaerospora]|eukprot:RKP08662.1 ornithine decarboxylase [Thamnocephalis sphaerospora]
MSVDDALRHQLAAIEATGAEENAFFVADLSHLHLQQRRWKEHLPRVQPFYAVKCNPSPPVLRTLAALGTNFDCASKSEIQAVLEAGVSADRIIYANPCKQISHIRYAVSNGVRLMTFDNADELRKVRRVSPDVGMVLRILTDDSKSVCQLGLKFGAPMDRVESLLEAARDFDVKLAGVSFHVGSGCYDAAAFDDAVCRARRVFDLAPRYGHYNMHILDVGGGFPGSDAAAVKFDTIASVLGPSLDRHFPAESGVTLIAEPGRYYVEGAFTLAVNVIARRMVHSASSQESPSDEQAAADGSEVASRPSFMYYVNDGVYGSFNCTMFDHAVVTPHLLQRDGCFHADVSALERYECSIWGPTCDSIDRINPRCVLPELHVGDWLRYDRMGAYTICAASRFNGFKQSHVIYVDTAGICAADLVVPTNQ